MATTSIWAVKGWLGHVVNYAENPEKTDACVWTVDEQQGLRDVMEYAVQATKTEQHIYVSGVNCDPENAREDMMLTKEHWKNLDGVIAYHGYQSFKPGEATPDIAHEIGVKLANEMWGDRFQVVVATHLDKGHIHNHFVVNSVSFADGHKWRNNYNDYYRGIRAISDRLCKGHGLSVVKPGEQAKSRSYTVWKDEKEGRDTWRSLIRNDIEDAISQARDLRDFITRMKAMGYTLKTQVKHIAVKPPGKERFVRLRSLGPGYTEEDIERRLREPRETRQRQRESGIGNNSRPTFLVLRIRGRRMAYRKGQIKGLRALYVHYLYRLGVIRKIPQPSSRTAFLLREDLRKLDRYVAQARLLNEHRINTLSELRVHKQATQTRLDDLTAQRQRAYTAKSQCRDPINAFRWAARAGEITQTMKALRKEVRLCDQIEAASVQMQYHLDQVRDEERQRRGTARKVKGGITEHER